MKKSFITIFLAFVFSYFMSATPFVYKIHDLLYVPGKNANAAPVLNKSLPKDNIRIFNFEKPVHVYAKVSLYCNGNKYDSDIISYYGSDILLSATKIDFKTIIENICKKNLLNKSDNISIDIQLVSKDIEMEDVSVDISNDDLCIRNVKVPADILPLFE